MDKKSQDLAYEDQLKLDMVYDTSDELLKLIVGNVKNHGPDPEIMGLIGTAMVLTIARITKVSPGFDEKLVKLLQCDEIKRLTKGL